MRHTRFSLLAAFALFMTGCAYKPSFINEYKIDVQQGNVLTQDMVAQLKPGQTREQVRFILGSPLLTDVFHRERWDYVYYFRDGSTRKVQRRQFSVFFDADHRLSRVSGDVEVAATEELTTPQARTRVIDLGAISEQDAAAGMPAPVEEESEQPGFFRRMLNWVGL
ncbi:outer membrane protein assembly factor BamE [Azonexus hydrophilus]|uniref:outer membrane protein assembly factor BamE n=1 Tax=Azonexus hydrophilus TaxID=418702 RepID=UPI001964DFB8|nr:outer membrane protein assembly factor BamE [Azonexus hydrophilus]